MSKPPFTIGMDLISLDNEALVPVGFRNALAWDSPHVRHLFEQKQYWLDDLRKLDHADWWIKAYPPNLPPEVEALNSKEGSETATARTDPYPFTRTCSATSTHGRRIIDGIVMGGKNAQGRPIIAKVIDSKGHEGAIYRHLLKEDPAVLKDNCILPILDIIDFDDRVSFVVMPKWHCFEDHPAFNPKTGMAYMHRNRIAHRDIREANVVCNFGGSLFANKGDLHQLRETRGLRLAYIDFNLSVMFPPETDLASPRLPRDNVVFNDDEEEPVPDLDQGQTEYNPFALEVAHVGYLLLRDFRYGIEDIPTLAPLISMMTDWDVSRRFTAEQALSFCEEHCMPRANEIWDKDLSKSPVLAERSEQATDAERWSPWHLTDPSFAEEWASYQPRPMPLSDDQH